METKISTHYMHENKIKHKLNYCIENKVDQAHHNKFYFDLN